MVSTGTCSGLKQKVAKYINNNILSVCKCVLYKAFDICCQLSVSSIKASVLLRFVVYDFLFFFFGCLEFVTVVLSGLVL